MHVLYLKFFHVNSYGGGLGNLSAIPPGQNFEKGGAMGCSGPKTQKWARALTKIKKLNSSFGR